MTPYTETGKALQMESLSRLIWVMPAARLLAALEPLLPMGLEPEGASTRVI